MKLYLSTGACSMASNIALHEAGIQFELSKVDKRTKRVDGVDFATINPKGYVPALRLDDEVELASPKQQARCPRSRRPTTQTVTAAARARRIGRQ